MSKPESWRGSAGPRRRRRIRAVGFMLAAAAAASLVAAVPVFASKASVTPKAGHWTGRWTQQIPAGAGHQGLTLEGDLTFTVTKSGKKLLVKDFTIGTIVGTQPDGRPVLSGNPVLLCADGEPINFGVFSGSASHQFDEEFRVTGGRASSFGYKTQGFIGSPLVGASVERSGAAIFRTPKKVPSSKRAVGISSTRLSQFSGVGEKPRAGCETAEANLNWTAKRG
jgi:hypothetical protein